MLRRVLVPLALVAILGGSASADPARTPAPAREKKPDARAWKITAATSTVAMFGLGATFLYTRDRQGPDDAHADRNQLLTWTTGPLSLAAAGVAGYALYRSIVRERREPAAPVVSTGRSTRKRRELTVTPVVTPGGAGATMRFDW